VKWAEALRDERREMEMGNRKIDVHGWRLAFCSFLQHEMFLSLSMYIQIVYTQTSFKCVVCKVSMYT
jgi:hypothetical protein